MLKDMCNQGYLEPEGHGRGTKYHLLDHGKKVDNLGSNLGSTLGSQPRKWMSKEDMQDAILRVCEDWVPLDYIASSVKRNPSYLLTSIMPSMLS